MPWSTDTPIDHAPQKMICVILPQAEGWFCQAANVGANWQRKQDKYKNIQITQKITLFQQCKELKTCHVIVACQAVAGIGHTFGILRPGQLSPLCDAMVQPHVPSRSLDQNQPTNWLVPLRDPFKLILWVTRCDQPLFWLSNLRQLPAQIVCV